MFSISLKHGSGFSFVVRQACYVDRLPEAERHAVIMLDRVFPDIEVFMVHTGNLKYDVYACDEPIAKITIKTEGDDV